MKLNNGLQMPDIGLGGCMVPGGIRSGFRIANAQKKIYHYAFHKGCKLYDTSSSYLRNEEILGKAIAKEGNREQVFLMVKISNKEQRTRDIKKVVADILSRLQTTYIDMLVLHWPLPDHFIDSWLAMEKLVQEGTVKSLGVSNFHEHHLEALLKVATIPPAINQIEVHPFLTQKPLIAYCKERNIGIVSYSPLARMHDVLMNTKTLRSLAKKYKKSVPQIIIRWNIQLGIVPIPRTTKPHHLDEFMEAFHFTLTEEEMRAVDALNENIRLRYNPDTCDMDLI